MNTRSIILIATISAGLLSACGKGKKEESASVTEKKVALAKLKSQKEKNDAAIAKLQEQLLKEDTSSGDPRKIKLVSVMPITAASFEHYIELQGKVDAENSSYISPRMGGGQVKQVLVKQGQFVRKGQLLLRLDNAIQSQQVVAARQQAQGVRTQLALAKSVYQRQKNLWDKGIGTEVQLLQAQTNVKSLEDQLSLIAQNVRLAEEQMKTANVYSDVNGIADVVNIRPGETFTGMTAAGPQIKIVNTSSLKVVSNMPENYLGKINQGAQAIVSMPDINRIYNTTVSYVGASIDAINRGFVVEARLPSDGSIKPNQIALLKVKDYGAAGAISIPLKTLQSDQDGKYVMIAVNENGKLTARKRMVTIGMINEDKIEIKSGLRLNDQLVTEGYNGLYEGQQLTTTLQ